MSENVVLTTGTGVPLHVHIWGWEHSAVYDWTIIGMQCLFVYYVPPGPRGKKFRKRQCEATLTMDEILSRVDKSDLTSREDVERAARAIASTEPSQLNHAEGYPGTWVKVIGSHRHGERGVIVWCGAGGTQDGGAVYEVNIRGEVIRFSGTELEESRE
jgi:hypothetical protein